MVEVVILPKVKLREGGRGIHHYQNMSEMTHTVNEVMMKMHVPG